MNLARLRIKNVAGTMRGGAALVVPYADQMKALFGSSIFRYYMLDEASGAVAVDNSTNHDNGTFANVTLAQPGIGDGKTAASFNGTSSKVTLTSTALNAGWPKEEGTVMFWAKVSDAAWVDLTYRYMFDVSGSSGVHWYIEKFNNAYSLFFGAHNQTLNYGPSSAFYDDWMHIAMTWSVAGNVVNYYVNGVLVGTDTSPGAAQSFTYTGIIGSESTGAYWFLGSIAHLMILNRPATGPEVLTASGSHSFKKLTVIGDSITAASPSFADMLAKMYNKSDVTLKKHSLVGAHIMTNLDALVVAAENDNADIIIVEMGINNDEASGEAAIQAKLESNYATLKASNPRARIYHMFLPGYTGILVDSPEDVRPNTVAAIAAACTAQGVTNMDTRSTPWILGNDTSDGWHPTTSGHHKAAVQIEALLP
jgi:hypothetical protein